MNDDYGDEYFLLFIFSYKWNWYITFKTFNLSLFQNQDSERKVKKRIYLLTFLEGSNIKQITPKWRDYCIF